MIIKNNLQGSQGLSAFKSHLTYAYQAYISDYKRYLKMRGFGDHIHDKFFVKRGFLECWLLPGFHRFWQTWNPGIGYFAYKVYLACGGKNRKSIATIVAFLVNGLIHNLMVSLIVWRWDFPLPFTFTLFGILTIVSRWLDSHINMRKWPKILHLVLNVGLVILSFDFGFRMNNLIRTNLFFGSQ